MLGEREESKILELAAKGLRESGYRQIDCEGTQLVGYDSCRTIILIGGKCSC